MLPALSPLQLLQIRIAPTTASCSSSTSPRPPSPPPPPPARSPSPPPPAIVPAVSCVLRAGCALTWTQLRRAGGGRAMVAISTSCKHSLGWCMQAGTASLALGSPLPTMNIPLPCSPPFGLQPRTDCRVCVKVNRRAGGLTPAICDLLSSFLSLQTLVRVSACGASSCPALGLLNAYHVAPPLHGYAHHRHRQ